MGNTANTATAFIILSFNLFCNYICVDSRFRRKWLFFPAFLFICILGMPFHSFINGIPFLLSLQASTYLTILPLIFLCRGSFFGIIYYAYFQLSFTHFIVIITSGLADVIAGYDSPFYHILRILLLFIFFIPLAFLIKKTGHRFAGVMMEYLHKLPWILFTFVPYLTYLVLSRNYFSIVAVVPVPIKLEDGLDSILLPLSLMGGLFALTTAIITTQARQMERVELAVLKTGKSYYKKLKVLSDNLRILTHDYKFQINAIRKLTEQGQEDKALAYIDQLNESVQKTEVEMLCNSAIINALLENTHQQCKAGQIDFFVQFEAFVSESFEYEMSVIIGNLLENAYTAALETPNGKRKYIELVVRQRENEISIMTQNSFDHYQTMGLKSRKQGGGIGIISIKGIVRKNGGRFHFDYDEEGFRVYAIFHKSGIL